MKNGWDTGAREEGLMLALNLIGGLLLVGGWFGMILAWFMGVF